MTLKADTPDFDWLRKWAQYAPRAVALESGETGQQLTYGEFFDRSQSLAVALTKRFGIARGDRVACLAQNEIEYVILFFALLRLGAILVPINFRFTAPEIEHIVRDSGCRLLIAQSEFIPATPKVKIWNFDGPDSLTEACRTPAIFPQFLTEHEDPCMILYTSGTTGFPKGAMISPRMIFWNSINTGLRLNLTQNDVVVSFLPLFHTGGWNVLTTPCLHRGAKVVLLRKFDPEVVLDLCASKKVTVLFGVPTTMDFMHRHAKFEKTDLASVRYAIVGGEPMPIALIEAWQSRGVPIRQGYGLTEFGPNVFSLNEEDCQRKKGSIGFPNFYVEARVVDDQGVELPTDSVGELILRGPVAMSGYWNNPEASAETLSEGWLRTGDLVRRDSEGYYFVVGRKKEMFISGGENVYPAEVEKVLRQYRGVRDVAVIGEPHAKWGESGHAFVVGDGGFTLDPDALRDFCRTRLAKFKVPQEFTMLDELPKTPSGKIAKFALASARIL